MNPVDVILLNARLREEIEPYADESIALLESHRLPVEQENEFLASMLDWERSPVLPISRWFEPELRLPPPDLLDENELSCLLEQVVWRLFEKRIVIEFADHLSDRELYCLVIRDILPAQEKRLGCAASFLRWHCVDEDTDAETWLAFYATDRQRETWAEETGGFLPERQSLPTRRRLPSAPAVSE